MDALTVAPHDALPDRGGLWSACVSAANTMALVADHDKVSFQNLPERLKVWGGELFGDSLDLDVLIAKTASLRSKLSAPLAAQLVEIAVEQGSLIEFSPRVSKF